MDGRPTTPTGPIARPGNAFRVRATNQNALAEIAGINAAERQRRLNQAARFREVADEMNAAASRSASSSAASSQNYEKKLRAKVSAHNSRTGMAKTSESEFKQWERDLASALKGQLPTVANIKRIGNTVRRNIKAKTGMTAGSTRRSSRGRKNRTLKRQS